MALGIGIGNSITCQRGRFICLFPYFRIDIRRLRIVCEFRIYISSCCRNSASYSSIDLCLGICIGNAIPRECSRFIRLLVQRIIDLAFGVSIGNAITCQRGRFICFVVQRIIDLAFAICIGNAITCQRGRFICFVVQRIIDLAFAICIGNAITCQRGRFVCLSSQLRIDLRRLRIVCEFRIYVSTCCRNSTSYSSIYFCLGIHIRLIRLAVQRRCIRSNSCLLF